MKYEVKLTHEAERNLHVAYQWYADRSTDAAQRWYEGVLRALNALEQNPERCPLANENSRFPIELRQSLYGSGRRITHRIIFAIRPAQVVVYAIRHVAQQDLELGEI